MNKPKVRLLIVDDSAFVRKVFSEIFRRRPEIEVVGTARNGLDALTKTAELQPDLVLLDVFMPELDGLGYLKSQMKIKPVPVILVSSAGENEDKVVEAMEAGAVDFIQKPTAKATNQIYDLEEELAQKVSLVAGISKEKLQVPDGIISTLPQIKGPILEKTGRIEIVVIGASTGGPQAFRKLIPAFPSSFPVPIVLILHMPVGYTQSFAKRLNETSDLEVIEAEIGMEVKAGRVIIGKAGYHLSIKKDFDQVVRCFLETGPYGKGIYFPSVDLLFRSASEVYGPKVLGVVLTGMGDDGTEGAKIIKSAGGLIYTEAEESAVIYGMPRSVDEAGLSDKSIPLYRLAERIIETI
jgi:two-component system, chemotaxis family, protein-glutamate methylesterase/glutaminase